MYAKFEKATQAHHVVLYITFTEKAIVDENEICKLIQMYKTQISNTNSKIKIVIDCNSITTINKKLVKKYIQPLRQFEERHKHHIISKTVSIKNNPIRLFIKLLSLLVKPIVPTIITK